MKAKYILLLFPLLLTSCNSAPSIAKDDAVARLHSYLEYNSDISNFKPSAVMVLERRYRENSDVTTIENSSYAYNDSKNVFYVSTITQKENDPSSKETETIWNYLTTNENGTLTEYIANYYSHKGTTKKEYRASTIINIENQDLKFEVNLFKDILGDIIKNNIELANASIDVNGNSFYYGSWMENDLTCDINLVQSNIIYHSRFNDYRLQEAKYQRNIDSRNFESVHLKLGYETFTPSMPNLNEYTLK